MRAQNCKKSAVCFALCFAFFWNAGVYYGARLLTASRMHYDLTTALDGLIPFLPWTISIYWGSYLFWAVNYFLCAAQDRRERMRFFGADALAKGICFLFFLLLPTTNVRPEPVGSGFWERLMRLLYQLDAADNLFPSIHCLASWLCWIGIRRRPDIPHWYRCFSLAAAIAVCISTLTTKQHVIIDVIGGIVLAEACYCITGSQMFTRFASRPLNRVKKR